MTFKGLGFKLTLLAPQSQGSACRQTRDTRLQWNLTMAPTVTQVAWASNNARTSHCFSSNCGPGRSFAAVLKRGGPLDDMDPFNAVLEHQALTGNSTNPGPTHLLSNLQQC